jgi:Ca2+-binding EF-hand superfamily protein
MRYTTSLCALALGCSLGARAADGELDQYEEKCFARAAERFARANRSDRGLWLKEMAAAFPGKAGEPTREEDFGAWFDLLAGKNGEWRRADAPNPRIAELFDKMIQRMELGPVPSVTRDEFRKYARHALRERDAVDLNDEADRTFRALDRNGDGELARDELTIFLRDEKVRVDADGNGRISKAEYREHFKRKVASKAESLAAARAAENPGRPVAGKPGEKAGKDGLPDWFAALDADKDGQISLFEWRDDGRPAATFQEMDLDADGLLTKDEYLRYLKRKAAAEDQRRREEGK